MYPSSHSSNIDMAPMQGTYANDITQDKILIEPVLIRLKFIVDQLFTLDASCEGTATSIPCKGFFVQSISQNGFLLLVVFD